MSVYLVANAECEDELYEIYLDHNERYVVYCIGLLNKKRIGSADTIEEVKTVIRRDVDHKTDGSVGNVLVTMLES